MFDTNSNFEIIVFFINVPSEPQKVDSITFWLEWALDIESRTFSFQYTTQPLFYRRDNFKYLEIISRTYYDLFALNLFIRRNIDRRE